MANVLLRSLVGPVALRSDVEGRVRRASDAATVLVFLAGIAVPTGGFLLRTPVQPRTENRPLAPRPATPGTVDAARAYPAEFEKYLNDRVGYREVLLDWHRAAVFDALGDPTCPDVWVGRRGWLYLDVTAPSKHAPADPPVAQWAAALADRQAWCAARGIGYVVVVAPEKSDVYRENLPRLARRRPPPDLTSRLATELRGTPVRFVDPRPALATAKAVEGDRLYYRLDSHWTDVGAGYGYQEIGRAVAEVVPGFAPTPPAGFTRRPIDAPNRDLARMLGLPPERCVEAAECLVGPRAPGPVPVPPATVAALRGRAVDTPPMVSSCPTAPGPVAVWFGDSFTYSIITPLKNDFRRLTTVGTYDFPDALIEAERPAVVVQELVARTLRFPPPPSPPGVADARLRSAAPSPK